MKIFNISDVVTPSLTKHGLFDQTFSIGGQMVKPGSSITVDDAKKKVVGAQVRHLMKFGAIAVGKVPDTYKPTAQAAPAATPSKSPPEKKAEEKKAEPEKKAG